MCIRDSLSDPACARLLMALSGTLHLVSDYGLFTTLAVLDAGGLLGSLHSVHVGRGPARVADPGYLPSVCRGLGISRHARCVYIDSNAGAIVAAKLLGWEGCLVARPTGALRRTGSGGHRVGHGAWYDRRFATLRRALSYYIFGEKA